MIKELLDDFESQVYPLSSYKRQLLEGQSVESIKAWLAEMYQWQRLGGEATWGE